MRLFCGIFLPWLSFFSMDQIGYGIICIFLQCSILGWPVASAWALFAVTDYETDIKLIALKENIYKELHKDSTQVDQEYKENQDQKIEIEKERKNKKNMY